MIIANPIYDVVFKRLMENEQVAKFFISTLLDEEVISVNLRPQEFTYDKDDDVIAVLRLDFIAIIKTDKGENKKVLIEVQKAKSETDLMRFRNYLAEQYKKEEVIDGKEMPLPITTIYVLGFKLKNIESACLKVERKYHDLINDTFIEQKNEFIEKLTHDSFVVQVERITGRYKSRLDKLLSVFEQSNFTDDTGVVKEFTHQADVEEVKIMTDILHHTGTNPKERKEIEDEREAWRTFHEYARKDREDLEDQIEERDKVIEVKDNQLKEKDKELKEKDKELEKLKKELIALKKNQENGK